MLNDFQPSISPLDNGLSQSIRAAIAVQPFLAGLSKSHLDLLAGLAMEVNYRSDEWIFREGHPANRFYLIQSGKVTIEVESDEDGSVPIRTLGPGDDLGWAWLFAPHYMHFSARTTQPVRALFVYGTRLRDECEADHELGYELMRRVAEVVVRNLKATEQIIAGSRGRKPEAEQTTRGIRWRNRHDGCSAGR